MHQISQPSRKKVVISLGYRCDVAFQIRRNFSTEIAMPFDWLVTPLSSIEPMIADNFASMATFKYLVPVKYNTKATGEISEAILNTRYNVMMRHDFPRDEHRRIVKNWPDALPNVRAKWAFLSARWRTLMSSNAKICFVRRGGNIHLPSEENYDTSKSEFECLFRTLRSISSNCSLLVADADCQLAIDGVTEATVGPGGYYDWDRSIDFWKGATGAWDRVFQEFCTSSEPM